jgi:anti-anti-sigma factor
VVHLTGCADLSAASLLGSLEAELRDATEIVLRVAELEFADTTFLRFLVRLRSSPEWSERRISLAGVTPGLKKVLEIAGLSRIVNYDVV